MFIIRSNPAQLLISFCNECKEIKPVIVSHNVIDTFKHIGVGENCAINHKNSLKADGADSFLAELIIFSPSDSSRYTLSRGPTQSPTQHGFLFYNTDLGDEVGFLSLL